MEQRFNLWVWDTQKWQVVASYPTSRKAHDVGRDSGAPVHFWSVALVGSQKDDNIRENCTDIDAPFP